MKYVSQKSTLRNLTYAVTHEVTQTSSGATRRHKCPLIWMKFGRDLLLQPTGARGAPGQSKTTSLCNT